MEALKADGYDFTVGIPIDTPINKAERVVSAGLGIGEKENMKLIEDLAVQAGAAIGSSRPVAETLKYVPLIDTSVCLAKNSKGICILLVVFQVQFNI